MIMTSPFCSHAEADRLFRLFRVSHQELKAAPAASPDKQLEQRGNKYELIGFHDWVRSPYINDNPASSRESILTGRN
jgi:hypothetical protein